MLERIRHRLLQAKARRLFGRKVHVFGPFTVVHPRNVKFGANCAINHGVFLLGQVGIEIGDNVVLSVRCMLIDGSLDSRTFVDVDSRTYANAPIRIPDGAWIGAGAIILRGSRSASLPSSAPAASSPGTLRRERWSPAIRRA